MKAAVFAFKDCSNIQSLDMFVLDMNELKLIAPKK